jgi:hypothetical protein
MRKLRDEAVRVRRIELEREAIQAQASAAQMVLAFLEFTIHRSSDKASAAIKRSGGAGSGRENQGRGCVVVKRSGGGSGWWQRGHVARRSLSTDPGRLPLREL